MKTRHLRFATVDVFPLQFAHAAICGSGCLYKTIVRPRFAADGQLSKSHSRMQTAEWPRFCAAIENLANSAQLFRGLMHGALQWRFLDAPGRKQKRRGRGIGDCHEVFAAKMRRDPGHKRLVQQIGRRVDRNGRQMQGADAQASDGGAEKGQAKRGNQERRMLHARAIRAIADPQRL